MFSPLLVAYDMVDNKNINNIGTISGMVAISLFRISEDCNILSHEGLANVNIRKRMLYRHCYIPSFQAQAVQIILFNCMQKCPP